MSILGIRFLLWPKNGRVWKKQQKPFLGLTEKYMIAFIILLETMLVLMFFDHPVILVIRLIQFIAFYVLIIAGGKAMGKLRSKIDETAADFPESDIPDVLRSVSINQ
jgi:hypothetical protein